MLLKMPAPLVRIQGLQLLGNWRETIYGTWNRLSYHPRRHSSMSQACLSMQAMMLVASCQALWKRQQQDAPLTQLPSPIPRIYVIGAEACSVNVWI